MSTTLEERARQILKEISYITLATVSTDGQPWNSPLFAVHDESFSFYWTSSPEAQHSQNIKANNKVFIVVYDSRAAAGTGEAVYIEAVAEELMTAEEAKEAAELYYSFQKRPAKPVEAFLEPSARRFYRARPKRVWINAEEVKDEQKIDVRKEITTVFP